MISFEGRVSSQPPARQLLYRHVGRKPCFSPACCITSLQQKKLATQLTLRKPTQKNQQPRLPRQAFLGAAFRWYLCSAALLCLPSFFKIFDFKLYGALLSGGMLAVQLFVRLSFLWEQAAFRTRAAASAFRTLSFTSLGELESPKSLIRIFLATFCCSLGSFAYSE